jgi:3-oxoacyl-[acyl-carrier protein] reductase
LTRWLAIEWGDNGVLVNAICPGPIRGPRTDGFKYDLRGAPLRHLGDPRDIAQSVAFFASAMSNHVTGQTLNVDGGFRMD